MDQVAVPFVLLTWLSFCGYPWAPDSSSSSSREADRVILTRCQQDGANQNTFQAISSLLGNKTSTEVILSAPARFHRSVLKLTAPFFCRLQVFCRFQDLMGLFRTAARQSSSEEEAPPTDVTAAGGEG